MEILKEKIQLTEEQETLLIPLYCKAQEGNPIFFDPKAKQLLEQIDYDFTGLKVPMQTNMTVRMRAKQMDAYARTFLNNNPRSVILHLGCGLDSRFWRLDNGQVEWYDLDMPEVIELRRKFFPENKRYHLIASSAADLEWIDSISDEGRPVMIVAEGLLMYMTDIEVKALVLKLQEAFPGCHLVCDVFSKQTADRVSRHPSIKKTGATIKWGIADPRHIEEWHSGIWLKDEWFFTQSEDIPKLGLGIILTFKLVGCFEMAKRAHYLLYFTL